MATEGRTPRITWDVEDHGWDGDSYFPGCGASFTQYTRVATGRGYTAREALDDALETAACFEDAPDGADLDAMSADVLGGADASWDAGPCEGDNAWRTISRATPGARKGACCDADEGAELDEDAGCDCPCHNPEWAYRVSIRWRVLGPDESGEVRP